VTCRRMLASLGGSLRVPKRPVLRRQTAKPSVNYLNFDDYKGHYTLPPETILGNTSFTIADLDDLTLHPDILEDISGGDSIEGSPADGTGLVNSTANNTPLLTPVQQTFEDKKRSK
jgi:hypothetical protein